MNTNGDNIGDLAKDLMGKPAFVTSSEAAPVDFCRATARELGFSKEPTTAELFERVAEVGALCAPEDGPHLRLAYQGQPKGDYFWCAMNPIVDSGGDPVVFNVRRSGGGARWLNVNGARPGRRWGLGGPVVFRSRKSALGS